jgi:TatD DNase family protein
LFQDDLPEVLERAWQNGIERILIPGTDLASSCEAIRLSEAHPQIFAAVGVHPSDALTWNTDTLPSLRDLVQHPKVVAVGEIGLDYYRDHAPRPLQQKIFHEQLELAAEAGKPVILHNRDAQQDLLPIVFRWQQELPENILIRPGVFHSFDGDLETAQKVISSNFMIGIGGPVTFKNAHERQNLASFIPIDHILLETDAPYLTPHPFRGKRNEPAYILYIGQKIADLRQIPFEELAVQTSKNADALFCWRAFCSSTKQHSRHGRPDAQSGGRIQS